MIATTYLDLTLSQEHGCDVLAKVQAFERITSWTQTAGRSITWQCTITQDTTTHSFRVIDVVRVVDPTLAQSTVSVATNYPPITTYPVSLLTVRSSVALVDSNPGSFYFDTATSILYVSLSNSSSPNGKFTAVGFYLYFNAGRVDGEPFVDPDDNTYYPYLVAVPNPTKFVNDPLYGVVVTGSGSVVLNSASGDLDQVFSKYIWEQGRIEIRLGGDSLPYSEYQTLFVGTTQNKVWSETGFVLEVKDANEDLKVQVGTSHLFDGTEATTTYSVYLNGDTNTTPISVTPSTIDPQATNRLPIGQIKPIAYGNFEGIKPVRIGGKNNSAVYLLSWHPNYKITGVAFAYTNASNQIVRTTTGFSWYCNAENNILYVSSGSIDLNSASPQVDFYGKKDAPGNWIDNFADIVYDLLYREVGVTTQIDTTILDRSRFLCNLYTPRVYLSSGETLTDILGNICRSTFSYFFITNSGKYAYYTWAPNVSNETDIIEESGDYITIDGSTDATRVYNKIIVEFGYNPSRPDYVVNNSGTDPTYLIETISRGESLGLVDKYNSYTISGTYLADDAGAFTLATRVARACSKANLNVTFESALKPIGKDLMDRFAMTRQRLPTATQGGTFHSRVTSMKRDLANFKVEVTVDDQMVIGYQGFIYSNSTLAWGSATADQKETVGFWTDNEGFITTDPASWGKSRYF